MYLPVRAAAGAVARKECRAGETIMKSDMQRWFRAFRIPAIIAFAALVLAGCGGGSSASSSTGPLPPLPPATKGKYFTHIVIVVQENRTFDNLFATYPGADGTRTGELHDGSRIPLMQHDLYDAVSPDTQHSAWVTGYNHGLMNGFDLIAFPPHGGAGLYQYVNPAQIQPYWTLAKQYVLADHMFQTQGTGSFTAHQDLIAGGAMIDPTHSLIDFPTQPPWGCDAPTGTVTTLVTAANQVLPNDGPFPCLKYRTLRDTLDSKRNHVALLRAAGRPWLRGRFMECVRRDRRRVSRTRVVVQRHLARNQRVQRRCEQHAPVGYLGDTRLAELGSSRRQLGYRPVVGRVGRQRHRGEPVLGFHRDRHRLGRLGRIVRPRRRRRLSYRGLGFRVPMIVVSPYVYRG